MLYMIIRKAELRDLLKLVEFDSMLKKEYVRYNKEYFKSVDETDFKKEITEYITNKIRSEKDAFFVALEDGKIVGMCIAEYEKRPPIFEYRDSGTIDSLYVSPEFRQKGIATALLQESIAWFRSKNLKFAAITVHELNLPAISAYKKVGFRDFCKKMLIEP